VSRPVEEGVDEDVIVPGIPPRTTPIIAESQGGDTIFVKPLAIKDSRESTTTARYYICLGTPPQEASPEPTELPASTASTRIE
jgi:hypothetical protein